MMTNLHWVVKELFLGGGEELRSGYRLSISHVSWGSRGLSRIGCSGEPQITDAREQFSVLYFLETASSMNSPRDGEQSALTGARLLEKIVSSHLNKT